MHDDDNTKEVCDASFRQEVDKIFQAAQKGTIPEFSGWPWDDRPRIRGLLGAIFVAQVVGRDKTFLARCRQTLISKGAPMDEIRRMFGR